MPHALHDAQGTALTPDDSGTGSDLCDEIGAWAAYTLEVGTYQLQLGPTAEDEVTLVVLQQGEEEEPE